MVATSYPSRRKWLAARKATVGSSESRVLFDQGYRSESVVALWQDKSSSAVLEREVSDFVLAGNDMETAIRSIFSRLENVRCKAEKRKYTIHTNPDHYPRLSATVDSWVDDKDFGQVPGELKNVSVWEAGEWADGMTPLRHLVQLQHQMAVTGTRAGWLIGLLGGNDLQRRRIERHDGFIASLTSRVDQFWKFVETKQLPALDASPATTQALKLLHPNDNGEVLVDDNLIVARDSWLAAKEAIKKWEEEERRWQNELLAAIGDFTYLAFSDGSGLSLKTTTRTNPPREASTSTFRVLRAVKKVPSTTGERR